MLRQTSPLRLRSGANKELRDWIPVEDPTFDGGNLALP